MSEYAKKALDRLQHFKPKRSQYNPHFCSVPTYGTRPEMFPDPYNSNIIDKKATKRIQYIVGYIMPGQLIQQCFDQLMKYRKYNQSQKGTPRKIKNVTRLCSNTPKCNNLL